MKLIIDFRNNLRSTQFCSCYNSYKYKNRLIGGLLFNFRSGSNKNKMNYVIYTPCGADYTTCPVCGCSANFYDDNDEYINYSKWDRLTDVDNDTDINEWDYCALFDAIQNKNEKLVKLLLQNGAQIRYCNHIHPPLVMILYHLPSIHEFMYNLIITKQVEIEKTEWLDALYILRDQVIHFEGH
jgi:hypothetical protein